MCRSGTDLSQTNNKVLTETGSRTQGLSFNVQSLYQPSYLDRLLFCYLNSEFIPTTRVWHCVCGVRGAGWCRVVHGGARWYMYVGCYSVTLLNHKYSSTFISIKILSDN